MDSPELPDVISLPPQDKRLGSCPECGKPLWESYFKSNNGVKYNSCICPECATVVTREQVIPF